MRSDELMAKLRDPFPATDIEWRVQSSGKTDRGPWVRVLAYVTNRAIMERLDATLGIDGWRNEFMYAPSGAVLCGISLKFGDEWITKWDGANETDIEAAKGGISNAMKRAAVQWGIGRYLYNLEEGYATIAAENDRTGYYLKANKEKHGNALRWHPPKLPRWALPGGTGDPDTQVARSAEAAMKPAEDVKLDPAKLPDYHNAKMPGTSAHFNGFGGKRLRDIPTRDLELSVKALRDLNQDRYNEIIETIGDVLADRASTEASNG